VIPYYQADEAWLKSFDFPNNSYILETTAGLTNENTMGIHSHGSGYTAWNTAYEMPVNETLEGQALIDWQIEKVEDLIIDEEALEFAFEGYRYYDLMRVSLHRGDPTYLANRIYMRRGEANVSDMRAQILADLNDMNNWYLKIDE